MIEGASEHGGRGLGGRLAFDLHPTAGPVVRKGGEAEALGREAEALRAAAGPGVVELIEVAGPPGQPSALVLAAATGDPLTEVTLPAADVAPVMAAVASTLARLHAAGVVHGALEAEHVILGPEGPVLCGLGHAALRTELDHHDHGWAAATAADVLALGELVDRAVAGLEGTDPVLRQALRRVVERATRSEPEERPSAADIATSLRDLVPGTDEARSWDPLERLRPRAEASDHAERSPARRWLGTVAVAAGGAALAVVAAPALAGSPPRPHPPPTAATTTVPPSTTSTTHVPVGERVWPAPCAEPCSSPTLRHHSASYSAGRPGDLALVLDAGCDGRLDAVVVRPTSGAVFVFGHWPGPGESSTAEPVGRFPTAVTAVEATDLDGDGCPELVGASLAGPLPLRVPAPAR